MIATILVPLISTLTLRCPGEPLKRLLPKIGKATGLIIAPKGEVGECVVALKVTNQTGEEIIQRIAAATGATVTKSGEKVELEWDRGARLRLGDEEKEEWLKTIELGIKSQDNAPGDLPYAVLKSLNPSDLASVGRWERRVWSTTSVGTIKRVGQSTVKAFRTWAKSAAKSDRVCHDGRGGGSPTWRSVDLRAAGTK